MEFNLEFNLDKPDKLSLSSKALKEELRKIGFHHTWGQWIYENDKSFRLSFKCFKGKATGKFSINLTVRTNHFDYNIISDRMSSIEDLKKQIFEYYEFKKNHPEVGTYIGMKTLPVIENKS